MAALGTAAAVLLTTRVQQKAVPVIGVLGSGSPGMAAAFLAALRQGLSEAGYVEVAIEYRWAGGLYSLLPAFAADLAGRKVDVIVALGHDYAAQGGTPPALAASSATSTIPIVFSVGVDPVESGLVASLARPSGNLTGFSRFNPELMPKRLQLLSELVPQARVIALLVEPNIANAEPMIRDVQEAARARGVQLQILKAGTESEIDIAFSSLVQLQVGGVLVGPGVFFFIRRKQLLALASRHAIPAMYDNREYVAAGGLITYAASVTATGRQVGICVGRILKGAKPADLPVQQPTTLELVINLKTAKALGLTVPRSILARADEVIE
jgi:putative ABC transport system substrate-binding protein